MTEQDSVDDLAVTQTPGYKAGEKKTLEEYSQLDANDESLRKWKESLGLNQAASPKDDPRKVVVLSLTLEVPGRDDVVADLSSPEAIKTVEETPFTIKEGIEYRLKIRFRVQHEVVSGLKYLQIVKRKGIRVDRAEEMIGSYGPAEEVYEKKFLADEAPSGMLARGHYTVRSRVIDDDGHAHLDWSWTFDIKKDW
ncbi:MAG: immunoglobulin E-set [Piptocephalis tieghemiana]|nr:MAG: immunoglobulin E-set [Piptocephalis tieghemiana]